MFEEKFLAEIEDRTRKVAREEIAKIRQVEEPLLSKKEIAKRLGITYTTFETLRACVKIPSHLIGRRLLFKESEVRKATKTTDKFKYLS